MIGQDSLDQYDAGEYEDHIDNAWIDEYHTYLVDKNTNKVIFCDGCEPEDATLCRHFGSLVDILNEVANEKV